MKSLVTIHSESLEENWGKLCIQMTGLSTTWIASLDMFSEVITWRYER